MNKLMKTVSIFFLCSWSLAFLPAAFAQTGGGGNCKELGAEGSALYAGKLTTLLKIASFRADVKYMEEVAKDLNGFLKTCGGEDEGFLPLVCNYDCHLQLGRYYLFMSSDFPYLSNSGGISRNDSPLSPQNSQLYAEKGGEILDRGITFLGRQQASDKNGEVKDDAFREFVRQMTLLNGMKIRLLMTMGDNWYMTVSEARIKRMNFLLNESMGSPGSGSDKDPNLGKAKGYYEKAMWTVIETITDIPSDATYDELRTDVLLLDHDLKTRLESVNNGLLFLNIDADQFTSINFQELSHRMDRLKTELSMVEGQVQGILERWYKNKEGEATRQIDENRVVQGQQVSLIAHKIGKMEAMSREYATTIRQEMNKVEGERDTYEFRQRMRSLEMDLERKMAEFDHRKTQLNMKKESDLIMFSKEAAMEKRNELRWLLNWKMSELNLKIQIDSLESQVTEYGRQTDRNNNRLAILEAEEAQREESLQINQKRIEAANQAIDSLKKRMGQLYMEKRAVTIESLCRIEQDLTYIGKAIPTPFTPMSGETACKLPTTTFTTLQYQKEICGEGGATGGFRRKLGEHQVQARAFLLKCVMGPADFQGLDIFVSGDDVQHTSGMTLPGNVNVDCGNFTMTETEFAKKVWKKEKELADQRRIDLDANITKIVNSMDYIKTWVRAFTTGVATAEAALTAIEATVMVVSSVPRTYLAAAGMTSGVITEVDASRPVMATVMAVRQAIERVIQVGKIEVDIGQKLNELEARLQQLRQGYANYDKELAIKALALHQAHYQLAGRSQNTKLEIEEIMLRNSMGDVECKSGFNDLESRINGLNAEHKRLISTLVYEATSNELIDFEIKAQENMISRIQNENNVLMIEKDKSRLQKESINNDNQTIAGLVTGVRKRQQEIGRVLGEVTDLANESNQVTNTIEELREKQKNQMLALTDVELNFVEARLKKEQTNTDELVDVLNKTLALNLMNKELNGKILAFQKETESSVNREQDNLMKLVSKVEDPSQKKLMFIATEEIISEMTKGIPEFLNTKRQVLEAANYTLHLMRRRYQTISGLTGAQENWPTTYVKNGTQLDALVRNIENQQFFNERQINIDVSEIVIPSNSGFARALAKNNRVVFEITPDAVDEAGMEKMGYLALWDKAKFSSNRNLALVDMLVGVQYSCSGSHRNKFLLTHKGSGMVFKSLSKDNPEVMPQLVVGPERSYIRPFYNLASGQDRMDRILDFWEDTFNVRGFPPQPGPPNDSRSILPYLGAPVLGTYEIEMRPGTCGVEDAVFTLYTVFASSI